MQGVGPGIAASLHFRGQLRCYPVPIRAGWSDMDKSDLLQGFYLRDLLVEPLRGQITGKSGSAHLPPKASEVLVSLATQPGEIVNREDLLKEVWGENQGSQEALSHAVSEIRHALDDHHDDPAFIQTLPKRGYRLLVKPELVSESTSTVVIGSEGGARVTDLGFLENLKQRGVLETGLAYLIIGWLLIQIADIVFSQLLLPQWVGTFVTVLVIAGFPIALVLSWFLEIRDGRAILDELTPSDARRRRFSRTYMSVVSSLAIAGVLVFIYDQFVGLPEEEIPAATSTASIFTLPPVLENSIAVLPFLNVDGSPATQIFSNGLVDSVINRLARVPGLMVSARGDSHTLEPNTASEKVRERLRVALYLEGSVEMYGDEIRVIVQLIDSESGFHLLSRSFDRPREDFFDIRDEITELTVANVRVALPAETRGPSIETAADPSIDTYLLYRQGIDALYLPATKETIAEALDWFDQALEQDPEYAAAHAGRCSALIDGYIHLDETDSVAEAEKACGQALQLNSNLDIVHTAMGNLFQVTGRNDESETAFKTALQINDQNAGALMGLGRTYLLQGKPEAAETVLKQATGLYPGDWTSYNNLGSLYYRTGRFTEAAEQFQFVVALNRSNFAGYSNLGAASMLGGDFEKAIVAFEHAIEIEPLATTYSNLGLLYYYTERLDEAIASHRKATQLAPNDNLSWSNLGDALWVAGQKDASREAYENARSLTARTLDVNPDNPQALMDMAWILTMLGETEAGRAAIQHAHELSDDPYISYIDGLMRARNGDIDGAIEALTDAVENGQSTTMMAAEPHLAALRDNEDFRKLAGMSQ